ncbi:hypothetical protein [Burkholderia oklahomensis]|uniref:hypothetical protein n=1 Tax=Burkholderia oklahomensis TaxID=342113 RepID=UPI000B117C1B|nr:hypothetical protein [Burkholderia oklahomensis]
MGGLGGSAGRSTAEWLDDTKKHKNETGSTSPTARSRRARRPASAANPHHGTRFPVAAIARLRRVVMASANRKATDESTTPNSQCAMSRFLITLHVCPRAPHPHAPSETHAPVLRRGRAKSAKCAKVKRRNFAA